MKLASIKLTSGEELLAEVLDYYETESFTSLIIKNPVKIEFNEIKRRNRKEYKLVPWIVFTNTNTYEINVKNIIGLSAVEEKEINDDYTSYFSGKLQPAPKRNQPKREDKFSTEYGYLGSVKEFREQLERLYGMDSPERPKDI